jgi:hypothetical protein
MTNLVNSGFTVAARSLRNLLVSKIDMIAEEADIKIDTPYNSLKLLSNKQQNLTLFFYHTTYAHNVVGIDDPTICPMTLHCLIIPFGVEANNSSVGENDLRLAGEVARVLHENPRIMLKNPANNEDVAWVQLLPAQLTIEEINKIWSLQANTPYRLSISCEITVVPMQLQQNPVENTAVSSIELFTYTDESEHHISIERTEKQKEES